MTQHRRGKRSVLGYVVSHTGKRGGPWEATFGEDLGTTTKHLELAFRSHKEHAEDVARALKGQHPNARALPLVRYELDAEEERLRDALVEAALAMDASRGDSTAYNDSLWREGEAIRALRAHRDKVASGLEPERNGLQCDEAEAVLRAAVTEAGITFADNPKGACSRRNLIAAVANLRAHLAKKPKA